MEDTELTGRNQNEIVFHFDVEKHSIPVDQFIETARSTQLVLDDFNEQLFDGAVRYQLRVRAPEAGGLVEVFGLLVVAGGGSIWAFLGTDIGKAFVRGLTGEEPAFWAEHFGTRVRKVFQGENQTLQKDMVVEAVDDANKSLSENGEVDAALFAELVVAFLAANIDSLASVGVTPIKFRKAFSGRNAIYKACIDNKEVNGLGFERGHRFPVARADFPRKIAQIPDLPEIEALTQHSWNVETVDIVVNSPNWKRDGRKWQAATIQHQDISFSIEDEVFWKYVDAKDIRPDIRDNMQVQWTYPSGLSKPSNVRVLRVLQYNGKKISQPLSDNELGALFEDPYIMEEEPLDLFNIKSRNADSNEEPSS